MAVLIVGLRTTDERSCLQFLFYLRFPGKLQGCFLLDVFTSTDVVDLANGLDVGVFNVLESKAFLQAGNGACALDSRVDDPGVGLSLLEGLEAFC